MELMFVYRTDTNFPGAPFWVQKTDTDFQISSNREEIPFEQIFQQ